MLSYLSNGHVLSLADQGQSGRTGLPFLSEAAPWAFNNGTYHHFVRADADSWQLRYDYDFTAAGLPGLTLMARYIRADNFRIAGQDAREWERDLGHVIQGGPLRGLGLRRLSWQHHDRHRRKPPLLTYTLRLW